MFNFYKNIKKGGLDISWSINYSWPLFCLKYFHLQPQTACSFKPTPNYSDEYLTTLSRFDNGRIVIPSNFVSSTLTTDVEESLIRTNRILLQCGSSLQNHTFSVGSTLSEAHKQLNHLLVENKVIYLYLLFCAHSKLFTNWEPSNIDLTTSENKYQIK